MTIRKSIRVDRTPEVSFKVFCEEIGLWWPGGFSGEGSRIAIDTRVGGRFYERRTDGTEYEIGRVTAYQPPTVVAFTWRAPSWDTTTQVEIRFVPEGAGTRVELEHSGWDRNDKLREARGNYHEGWDVVLRQYQKRIDDAA